MIKRNFFVATALTLSLVSCPLFAQEASSSDTAVGQKKAAEQKQAEKQEKAAQPSKKEKNNSSETFTPTEEISEDLSVSFPVDI